MQIERIESDYKTGLTAQQVAARVDEGFTNVQSRRFTKSYAQIFKDNIFTLFNLINVILAALIISTGSYRNILFMGIVISNIAIGVFQEIRAKRTLEKAAVVVAPKARVVRDGKEISIGIADIVLDDIIALRAGEQIVSDARVLSGAIEVNESLLTGESDVVSRGEGDMLFSGSYVVSGSVFARVEHVGAQNYANRITDQAQRPKKHPSELRDTLNRIIRIIGITIIPIGILMFCKHYFILKETITSTILSTAAALVGMIPEGLVILSSIALALGSINLARKRTLVQELYCIETLARVDTLCLDKTGTLTEGVMEVQKIVPLVECDVEGILGNMLGCLIGGNVTYDALAARFKKQNNFTCLKRIEFSSERKYSGVVFEEGTYIMGAYNFMTQAQDAFVAAQIDEYAKQGLRVITLGRGGKGHGDFEALALIILSDRMRKSAKQTLAYFYAQDVDIRIISGDDPRTVSEVARRAGLRSAERYFDASTLENEEDMDAALREYKVFGRVSPEQKKLMVRLLKKQGHVVGMTGDGVNDVQAFKESDVSIAMASGSQVATNCANLVLLDSNFDSMPDVLNEGRRVINNVQRVATLFLTKTAFSVLLALAVLVLPVVYPFKPIHLTFVSALTIGIPAFIMALEPNFKRIKGHFLANVAQISIPHAVALLLCVLYVFLFAGVLDISAEESSLFALIALAVNGYIVLVRTAWPFSPLRLVLVVLMAAGLVVGIMFGGPVLELPRAYLAHVWYHLLVYVAILITVPRYGGKAIVKAFNWLQKRSEKAENELDKLAKGLENNRQEPMDD